jgi:hypothetical protein
VQLGESVEVRLAAALVLVQPDARRDGDTERGAHDLAGLGRLGLAARHDPDRRMHLHGVRQAHGLLATACGERPLRRREVAADLGRAVLGQQDHCQKGDPTKK